jgi:hypothetical protein
MQNHVDFGAFTALFGPCNRQVVLGKARRGQPEGGRKTLLSQRKQRANPQMFHVEHNKNKFRAENFPSHRHFHFYFLPDRQPRSHKTLNSNPDIAETSHEACPRLRARL